MRINLRNLTFSKIGSNLEIGRWKSISFPSWEHHHLVSIFKEIIELVLGLEFSMKMGSKEFGVSLGIRKTLFTH